MRRNELLQCNDYANCEINPKYFGGGWIRLVYKQKRSVLLNIESKKKNDHDFPSFV